MDDPPRGVILSQNTRVRQGRHDPVEVWGRGGPHHGKGGSVDVTLVAACFGHSGDVRLRIPRGEPALCGDDLSECMINIVSHPLGVAANVEIGAFFQPVPEFPGTFEHPVLHVDLLGLVARERQVEPGQNTGRLKRVQFLLVKVVSGTALVAEEQPVLAPRSQPGDPRGRRGTGRPLFLGRS